MSRSSLSTSERIIYAHRQLRDNPLYFGSNDFREHVVWKRQESGRVVFPVNHESGEAGDEPAVMSVVVLISRAGFKFTSDANFTEPTQFCKTLVDAKPSFFAERPTVEPFKTEYSTIIGNASWLRDQAATAKLEKRGFLFDDEGLMRLHFRHVLFVPRDPNDPENINEDLGESFALENWPTSSALAEDELQIVKERKSHHVIPLPAYNVDGSLIEPHLYESTLKGALVRVDFKLTHWAIATKREGTQPSNTYVADVETIHLLAEQSAYTGTTKRKISATIPSVSSTSQTTEGKKRSRKS